MPIEGYKSITVSEETLKELKERAEKDGLSVPQLIEQYMNQPHSLNDLFWLDNPDAVKRRIDELSNIFYEKMIYRRHKQRAIELRKEGLTIEDKPLSYEERTEMENECRETANEIAESVINQDVKTYEVFKAKEEQKRLENYAGINRRQLHTDLLRINDGLKAMFGEKASLEELRKNIVEVSKLTVEWNTQRKYVPYLSDEDKLLDTAIATILGV